MEVETLSVTILARVSVSYPFTSDAARYHATIVERRRKNGRPIGGFDGLIAATARANGAAIATRNVRDFEGCGVDLIDPWTA